MIGQQYGKLTVLRRDSAPGVRNVRWLCRCDCGKEKVIQGSNIVSGLTRSCGCLRKGVQNRLAHGHYVNGKASRTYMSWRSMRARCLNPKNDRYDDYGGRGITICARWDSFENFLADMGERPEGTTLDRIENDGNYEPNNCVWATPTEQANNRRAVKTQQLRNQHGRWTS